MDMGCVTRNDILKLGLDGLMKIKGVGQVRAEMVVEFLSIDT